MTRRQPLLLATMFALTVHPSFAAEPADIEQIIVTASRSPMRQPEVGSAMTVIDRNQIRDRQARYVTDLLRAVPGFSISHSGAAGSQAQVRVRGAEANHVLVLIDGIRANDPASGDEFRWEMLSTADIERIEIVRGPQSALWGSDAVAAVVNVITRTETDSPRIEGYAESGSQSSLNAGLQGGTGSDDWSLGFSVDRQETDGINISRDGDEKDGSDLTTVSLSGRYQASDRLSFDLGLRSVDAWSELDPVDFLATGLPTDGDLATDARRTYVQAGTTLKSREGRVANHLTARYLDTSNSNLVDGLWNSSTTSDRLGVAYQADIALDANVLTLALEHERTRFEQRGEVGFGDPNQDQEMSVASGVAEFQGRPTESVTWLLSARYDRNSEFDDALTGRLSAAWQVSDRTRLRANAGTGQKAPTFIERFGFYPSQFVGNPDLKPEKSTSWDVGIEQGLLADSIVIGLTYFDQDLEDEINGFVFDPDTFMFTAENVAGKSQRKGLEAEARFRLTENLEVNATYTYTDSRESDQGSSARELRRPRHAGNLTANYRFRDDRANILLAADYGGSRQDLFFPPWPEPSERVTLANYWLVDLTASYDVTPRVSTWARVTNLLDDEYQQVYGYRTAGRAAYVGVRVNYGE